MNACEPSSYQILEIFYHIHRIYKVYPQYEYEDVCSIRRTFWFPFHKHCTCKVFFTGVSGVAIWKGMFFV